VRTQPKSTRFDLELYEKLLTLPSQLKVGKLMKGTPKIPEGTTAELRHVCDVYPDEFRSWLDNCASACFEARTHSTRIRGITKVSYGALAFIMATVSMCTHL